jgi:hypothetical protein
VEDLIDQEQEEQVILLRLVHHKEIQEVMPVLSWRVQVVAELEHLVVQLDLLRV